MTHYSVLIPQYDAVDAIDRILPRLQRVLARLILPYEILLIDDASVDSQRDASWVQQHASLRVLRFDHPRGTSAALTAGIAAARGDLMIALSPSNDPPIEELPQMISRLSRHDFVMARRWQLLSQQIRDRLRNWPRLAAGVSDLHASETMFWAARREAVAGLTLAPGAFRVLPALVAQRGFRVCTLTIANGLPARGQDFHLGLTDRLTALWLNRRFEPHLAREIPEPAGHPSRAYFRAGLRPQPGRFVPNQPVTPRAEEYRESA